ncbi:phosphatidate cytidylyltransferase [Oscillibacter sp.]|uniref:phosphatidate cytidylyltransferase n=1 Tax=Oscillibacter sp. TaxID=1945593 RepID=UPI00263763A1|nr:phosphatidate cytidylyltransferase [Oscillibacter sp.]MDD3346515.1 phosphatidate cytidylyltransferase [Oscillibacter sp.]
MKSRLLVSAVGIPVLLYVVLWAPPLVMMGALCILAGIAAMELMQCVGVQKNNYLFGWTMICAVFSVTWYYDRPDHMEILWFLYVAVAFLYAIFKAGEVRFFHITAGIFAVVVIPYAFSAFVRMEDAGIHRSYLLLPFILSFMSDTGGYFAGRAFGKHKLAPKVSPKKTVEGSVGGVVGNVLGAVAFTFVMDRFLGGGIGYGPMVLLGVLCSAAAQVGDLSFSLIKREFGIKDYGHLFLEHGGVLDRFDSVLFVTPLIEIVLSFVR